MAKLKVDQALRRARAHESRGETGEARALYEAILRDYPGNRRVQQALQALSPGEKPAASADAAWTARLRELQEHYNRGQWHETIRLADAMLGERPRSPALWNVLADAHKRTGDLAQAERGFRMVVELDSGHADGYSNLGATLTDLGRFEESIDACAKALAIKPDHAQAHNNMGIALERLGRVHEAETACRRALAIQPDYANAQFNLGNILKVQGRLAEAASAYQSAIAIRPDHVEALNSLGNAQQKLGQVQEAVANYRQALAIDPGNADTHNNLGSAMASLGHLEETVAAYRQAVAIDPRHADAYNNSGNVLQDLGLLDEAVVAYRNALLIRPDYADASNNMANALNTMGRLDEAIAASRRALEIEPDHDLALGNLLHALRLTCDWRDDALQERACERLGITTRAISPFTTLPWEDNPQRQLLRARRFASENFRRTARPFAARQNVPGDRIRVGYFSSDFHDHPVLHLIAGLLREHDKERFEIFAFSYGRQKDGALRQKAAQSVDHFIDIAGMADIEVVDLVRSHALDIAIDLNGYTQHTRSALFQYRLAPVQMNFLGFPGSMGTDFIDYIVADRHVIPPEQREFYDERIICLPGSYMPNDDAREISTAPTTRADFALPDDAFVFCCFNNNYKIGAREFDVWMRLLHEVPGSVLWLQGSNAWSKDNLRREASARGIDPERLIFAERVAYDVHLSRHRHADLFIDAFNFNAHTTASDALWSGLPVVTLPGKQFAARVAASLLHAVGLPELVTSSEAEYEALILALARDPARLAAIREKLAANRLVQPLFDTRRYARDLESALVEAHRLYHAGEAPRDIAVEHANG